jgi:tetratricopeptide (TPR) repeat protein
MKMNRLIKIVFIVILISFAGNVFAQTGRSESDFIYAKRLYEDGLYDLAAEALENYLLTYPDSPHLAEAGMFIGESLWKEGDYDSARNAFQQVAMDYPDDPIAISALFKIADSYEEENNLEKSIRALLRIPVFYPTSTFAPDALVKAAEFQIAMGKWIEAETPVQQVMNQYVSSSQIFNARILWAKILANRGEYEAAIIEAGIVADGSENQNLAVHALGYMGEWYSQSGQEAEAEASWQRILNDYPDLPENGAALINMASSRLKVGDAEKAERLLREAMNSLNDPDSKAEAIVGLGDALFLMDRFEGAFAQYQEIENPSSEVKFRTALTLEKLNRPDEAISLYREIEENNENILTVPSSWRSAELLVNSGRYQDAVIRYKTAEEKLDDILRKSEARYQQALIQSTNDPEKCIGLCENFTSEFERSPRVDDILWLRVKSYITLERYQDAINTLHSLIQNYPVSPYTEEAKLRIDYLQGYVIKEGDPSTKVAGLLAEVAGGLDNKDLALRLGDIYLNEYKDYTAAKNQFSIVLSDSTSSDDQVWLANEGLGEAIWRGYLFWLKGKRGDSRVESAETIDKAIETATGLIGLLTNTSDPEIRERLAFRTIRLGIKARTLGDRIRYQREAWQAFISDHPESNNLAEIYFDLADAFSVELPDDSVDTFGDPAIWYLETIRDEYSESDYYVKSLLKLGNRYLNSGREIDAFNEYDKLTESENSPVRAESELTILRLDSVSIERKEKAVQWLRYNAYYHPDVNEARDLVIAKLLDAKKYSEAKNEIDTYLNLNPEYGAGLVIPGADIHEYSYIFGRIYEGNSDLEKARQEYLLYLAYYPEGKHAIDIHKRLANIRLEQGFWESAINHYRWLIESSDDSTSEQYAKKSLARLRFEKGEFEESKKWAIEIIENSSSIDTIFIYDQHVIICQLKAEQLNDADRAFNSFKKKYSKRDDYDEAAARFTLEKGRLFSKFKNFIRSEESYKRVIRKYKNTSWVAEAKYELGRDYLDLKQYEKALDILTAMPREYPGDPIIGHVYWVLGNYYVSNDNLMDGISTYERVLSDSTYHEIWPSVYQNQIRAYKQSGFFAGALQSIQKYISLYPNSEDSFERKMDVGLMYNELSQFDLAIAQFTQLQPLADIESEAACQFYIAEALEKSGRLAEAVIEYKKVDYLGKRTKMQWAITALYSAGRVLERLGDDENAIEMYSEVVKREGLASPFGRRANDQIKRINGDG